MTGDLDLHGPTVTMFGGRDALDSALSDELGVRGRSTHSVTTPVGWLTSTTQAVVRLDTPSGDDAMRDLLSRDLPATHVVAVCETSADGAESERIDQLCRQCGDLHEVSLIWHGPLDPTMDDQPITAITTPTRLAAEIADEIGRQQEHGPAASFSSRVVDR